MPTTKKYSLPRDFATKWVAALRSGEYKQGRGNLFREGFYCCLGVAGFIGGCPNYTMEYMGVLNDPLPKECLLKIPTQLQGHACHDNLVGDLVGMNDGDKSFVEIADWIEENVEFV